jgi:hypothetical protein
MITASAAPQPFTPPWCLGQDGSPLPGARTYLVRPGGIMDRAMFEGVIAGPPYNAGRVFPWDLITSAEGAVNHLMAGDDLAASRGQLLDALAAWRANMLTPEALPADVVQLLAGVEMALRTYPEYAELRRAEARRTQVLPVLAAKWFLAGWQGIDAPFQLGPDGKVAESCLIAIPAPDLNALGWHAYNSMYAEQHRPLSPPPSTSGGTPPRSVSGGKRQKAAVAGK